MNGTPRLRAGAFPSTPQTIPGQRPFASSNSTPQRPRTTIPSGPKLRRTPPPDPSQEPLISTDFLDAASQRLLVVTVYSILWAWRLLDFYNLVFGGSNDSLWLFLKWIALDGVFLFSVPALRIPWLEPSSPALVAIYLAHVLLDSMIMFRIGIPVVHWLALLGKSLYNPGEESIDGHMVKRADLYNDPKSIQGKLIVKILPEGSAILNPDKESFCLGGSIHQVELGIQINQTNPILIELLRVDLDTSETEKLTIQQSQAKRLQKVAKANQKSQDSSTPLLLRYAVKKPGRYILDRVVDKSQLEVRPRSSEVMVVQCPQARLLSTSENKCKGELSDISFEVIGTPPLKVKYRKMVNSNPVEASFQSIQPDDFFSPLARQQQGLGTLAKASDLNASWARAQKVIVPVNETLFNSGSWWYSIDQVEDALGNSVTYRADLDDYTQPKGKVPESQKIFTVHERPKISLRGYDENGCDPQHALKVAKGDTETLPVKFESDGRGAIDTAHTVEYIFTPQDQILSTGEHNPNAQQVLKHEFKDPKDSLRIGESGLYSLKSVATKFCPGEVREPASCLLENPPQPIMTVTATNLTDRCAGNPIGLRLTLDLVGTPPFSIQYAIRKTGSHASIWKTHRMNDHRDQLELTPDEAGHYTYTFTKIEDRYYKALKLEQSVEQTVKPSASAHFESLAPSRPLCLSESASFTIRLGGEGPWNLEYELVHNGKRMKNKFDDITDEHFTIKTGNLEAGGEYSMALVSVEAGGCKEEIKEEVAFQVRHQRPKASFGVLDGKRSVMSLEGKRLSLPIRLTGERPWTIEYRNADDPSAPSTFKDAWGENFNLDVDKRGTYELMSVKDSSCPGVVDETMDRFEVNWIQRPTLQIAEGPTVEVSGNKLLKKEVCEGDEDFVELLLTGNPPFEVRYEENAKPDQGQKSTRKRDFNAALGAASVQLDTEKAGLYEYKFSELADNNYDHDPKRHAPVILTQRVNPRPTARFGYPGKTYNFCVATESNEDVIPVTLTGVPPFVLEVEIKHSGNNKPDLMSFPNIQSQSFSLRIPHKYLREGHSSVTIKKVRDARGCQSRLENPQISPKVQVSVHDPPTISALEAQTDFCVGEYLSFQLSGSAPFEVHYTFENKVRKASVSSTLFKRVASDAGIFTIDAVSDSASQCKAAVPEMRKIIHPRPRGALSKGRVSHVDIHEGGETDIVFDFEGTPPFEFTYTRSTEPRKGQKQVVLETKTEKTVEKTVTRKVSSEGEYELISVKDAFCFSTRNWSGEGGKKGQKMIMN